MERLDHIIFYSIEKALKAYRQFAQKQITELGLDITIDQWLVLKTIQENPGIPQQQIAEYVFKDVASLTRMIELLVKKGLLNRDFNDGDRRRFKITITRSGEEMLETLAPVIVNYRTKALKGISKQQIEVLQMAMSQIVENTRP